jgi:hypothetical protein
METIKEVGAARMLMTEAKDWSVMKWLTEKKRVRKIADLANETLDRVELEVQRTWSADLKAAYDGKASAHRISADVERLGKESKAAHDAAIKARADAEETFDKAERRMSASLAREGCHKAIAGWDLHEEAIRMAGTAVALK